MGLAAVRGGLGQHRVEGVEAGDGGLAPALGFRLSELPLFDAWLDPIESHREASTVHRYPRKFTGRIGPALGHIRIDRPTPKRLYDQYRA